MNSHRLAKNEQLTRLAAGVTEGIIVELGAYRGEGTAALLAGARVPVIAVDDYAEKRGWAGEPYRATDRQLFNQAVERAGHSPLLLVGEARQMAAAWSSGKIGLLVWDLGAPGRLLEDFVAWQHWVTGRFAVHDTDDQRLGSKDLNPTGWHKHKDGVFWILER